MSERLDAIKARLQRAQPSVTQLEILRDAISTRGTYSGDIKPAGRLRRLPMTTTLNILKANGWIEEGLCRQVKRLQALAGRLVPHQHSPASPSSSPYRVPCRVP